MHFLTYDITRPILSYEAHRAIQDYLTRHSHKRTYAYLASRVASDDSKRLLRMLSEEH